MELVQPETFMYLAEGMTGRATGLHSVNQERRFNSLFGVSPIVCCRVWQACVRRLPSGAEPVHLLWALLFLKTYATEDVLCAIAHVDRKTYRKYTWKVVTELSNISIVSHQAVIASYELTV